MPYPVTKAEISQEMDERLKKYFSGKKSQLEQFGSKEQFISWFKNQLEIQQDSCHYCNTSLITIRQLLNAGIIKGRKVKADAERGPNFEIDRKDPFGAYEPDNCVLCCYYCNNDKSNTFTYAQYLEIFGPKRKEISELLQRQLQ